jgi:putative endonuclease
MYTVYILKSLRDHRSYVGVTNNFERRFQEHQKGRVHSTKNRKPFTIFLTEEYDERSEAKRRECWWKSGVGRRELAKRWVQKYPNSASQF